MSLSLSGTPVPLSDTEILDAFILALARYLYKAFIGVFDGIAQKIYQDLFKTPFIAVGSCGFLAGV